jgi:hypothetical protein
MEISLANVQHIGELSILFDQYRLFYKQTSDLGTVRKFLEERVKNNDSVILTATDKGSMVRFA